MKKSLIYIIIAALIGISAFGIWRLEGGSSNLEYEKIPASNSPNSISQIPSSDLTEIYTDNTYNFSFRYPAGYAVTTFPDPQDETANNILIQNASTTVGFQIHVAPIDEDISVLTVERIRQDLPDIVITDPQEVILGAGAAAGKGVAFRSDDPSFGGASREVWFIFSGNIYQIRTYAAYDSLVQAVLSSWEFR